MSWVSFLQNLAVVVIALHIQCSCESTKPAALLPARILKSIKKFRFHWSIYLFGSEQWFSFEFVFRFWNFFWPCNTFSPPNTRFYFRDKNCCQFVGFFSLSIFVYMLMIYSVCVLHWFCKLSALEEVTVIRHNLGFLNLEECCMVHLEAWKKFWQWLKTAYFIHNIFINLQFWLL